MKLTINTSFQENASSQYLLILVDSEQLQQSAATYQINKFEEITTATQYKAGLNETLALVGNVPASANACLVGLGKTAELQPGKLAKVAQTIVKAAQKKFQQISVDISALPAQFHNVFALLLTQAAYAFDEFKSKKNEFVLEQINLIATDSPVTAEQLQLLQAVQTGQNLARDLGNRPGNICFPE